MSGAGASRPFTLPASVVPVLVGSALAFREGQADPGLFVLILVASLLVQVGANLVDEYSDHGRVEEGGKMIAPYKVIALGLLSVRAVKLGALISFGLATLAGLYIVAVTGWPILVVSLASLAAAYLYAGGPKPLGAYAIGQPMVFVFMGLIMVMGTYYVHTQTLTVESFLLAASVGCTVTAILVANDLRDREEDPESRKKHPGHTVGASLWPVAMDSVGSGGIRSACSPRRLWRHGASAATAVPRLAQGLPDLAHPPIRQRPSRLPHRPQTIGQPP